MQLKLCAAGGISIAVIRKMAGSFVRILPLLYYNVAAIPVIKVQIPVSETCIYICIIPFFDTVFSVPFIRSCHLFQAIYKMRLFYNKYMNYERVVSMLILVVVRYETFL